MKSLTEIELPLEYESMICQWALCAQFTAIFITSTFFSAVHTKSVKIEFSAQVIVCACGRQTRGVEQKKKVNNNEKHLKINEFLIEIEHH